MSTLADSLDWSKGDGLLPAVVQDADSGRVLMLGFMNAEALRQTLASGRVVFFSRSRQRLWTKGESSGNGLTLVEVRPDCDADTLLVTARPSGPVCHRGTTTCFDLPETNGEGEPRAAVSFRFLSELAALIRSRQREAPQGSYTAQLFAAGTRRQAQKLGEEAVELALAATSGNAGEVVEEAADVLYHLLVLLRGCDVDVSDVAACLESRHRS